MSPELRRRGLSSGPEARELRPEQGSQTGRMVPFDLGRWSLGGAGAGGGARASGKPRVVDQVRSEWAKAESSLQPAPAAIAVTGDLPAQIVQLLADGELREVVAAWQNALAPQGSVEPRLAAVVDHLIRHPGSLVRAQLAHAVGTTSGLGGDRACDLAVAVELFHSASLVFDDLPAMDDATTRRGVPCPHVLWGEGFAILGGLALVTRGYARLWAGLIGSPPDVQRAAVELVDSCLGLDGILGGQARDLAFAAPLTSLSANANGPSSSRPQGRELEPARSAAEVLQVAAGKSAPLLRLAIELPALVAGVDASARGELAELAGVWGLAYQALDDFKDRLAGAAESGKTPARDAALGRPNLAAVAGDSAALAMLDELLAAGRAQLARLDPAVPTVALPALQGLLEAQRYQAAACLNAPQRAC